MGDVALSASCHLALVLQIAFRIWDIDTSEVLHVFSHSVVLCYFTWDKLEDVPTLGQQVIGLDWSPSGTTLLVRCWSGTGATLLAVDHTPSPSQAQRLPRQALAPRGNS